MKNLRTEPTLVEKAISVVPGFDVVFKKLSQQVTLRGQSQSTLDNYIRRMAGITLHFGKLPGLISDDEINEYLCALALNPKSPSRSNFKHAVYGLRYYFRLIGHNKRAIDLPSLKKESKLPVILNRNELRQLSKAPALLKHKIVLCLIYSAGLRGQEVINLKTVDTILRDRESYLKRLVRVTGCDFTICPVCKKGKLHRIAELPKIRSPANFYASVLNIE